MNWLLLLLGFLALVASPTSARRPDKLLEIFDTKIRRGLTLLNAGTLKQCRYNAKKPNLNKLTIAQYDQCGLAENHKIANAVRDILNNPAFIEDAPVTIIVPGFLTTLGCPAIETLASSLISQYHLNVLALDMDNLILGDYLQAAHNVRAIAKRLGQFLKALINGGVRAKDIHIIGHSLGAHIAGIASKNIKKPSKIGWITGLDPASPCFKDASVRMRLSRSDANFVDVIHTSHVGIRRPIGKVDFYPNGGVSQPDCEDAICIHTRPWDIYIESIMSPCMFPALKCLRIQGSDCVKYSEDQKIVFMGYGAQLSNNAYGSYFVSTQDLHHYHGSKKTKKAVKAVVEDEEEEDEDDDYENTIEFLPPVKKIAKRPKSKVKRPFSTRPKINKKKTKVTKRPKITHDDEEDVEKTTHTTHITHTTTDIEEEHVPKKKTVVITTAEQDHGSTIGSTSDDASTRGKRKRVKNKKPAPTVTVEKHTKHVHVEAAPAKEEATIAVEESPPAKTIIIYKNTSTKHETVPDRTDDVTVYKRRDITKERKIKMKRIHPTTSTSSDNSQSSNVDNTNTENVHAPTKVMIINRVEENNVQTNKDTSPAVEEHRIIRHQTKNVDSEQANVSKHSQGRRNEETTDHVSVKHRKDIVKDDTSSNTDTSSSSSGLRTTTPSDLDTGNTSTVGDSTTTTQGNGNSITTITYSTTPSTPTEAVQEHRIVKHDTSNVNSHKRRDVEDSNTQSQVHQSGNNKYTKNLIGSNRGRVVNKGSTTSKINRHNRNGKGVGHKWGSNRGIFGGITSSIVGGATKVGAPINAGAQATLGAISRIGARGKVGAHAVGKARGKAAVRPAVAGHVTGKSNGHAFLRGGHGARLGHGTKHTAVARGNVKGQVYHRGGHGARIGHGKHAAVSATGNVKGHAHHSSRGGHGAGIGHSKHAAASATGNVKGNAHHSARGGHGAGIGHGKHAAASATGNVKGHAHHSARGSHGAGIAVGKQAAASATGNVKGQIHHGHRAGHRARLAVAPAVGVAASSSSRAGATLAAAGRASVKPVAKVAARVHRSGPNSLSRMIGK